jgi:predicted secreted hydrolase
MNVCGTVNKWERAETLREWSFPRDHGQHSSYQTEWWYFTGHLDGPSSRRFGFQFTIFRYGLQVIPVQASSKWGMRDVWFGHFTITDVASGAFRFAERVNRGVFDQAGASQYTLEAWLEGGRWRVGPADDAQGPHPKLRLRAEEPDYGLELELTPLKPPVFHGLDDGGLSQKSTEPGNASHYYSFTRMSASGTIRIGKERFPVNGAAWFDHEFSTSMLAKDQAGWDWFSIQLGDGTELMVYQMRRKDGSVDPASKGSFINALGVKQHLASGEFKVTGKGQWKSPRTGAIYPSGWRIEASRLGLDLSVLPLLADQELAFLGSDRVLTGLAYWEGACDVTGTRNGQPISGRAYSELSGYHRPLGGADGR